MVWHIKSINLCWRSGRRGGGRRLSRALLGHEFMYEGKKKYLDCSKFIFIYSSSTLHQLKFTFESEKILNFNLTSVNTRFSINFVLARIKVRVILTNDIKLIHS